VKHNSIVYRFVDSLDQVVGQVTDVNKKQIVDYFHFLLDWNKKINLVSRQSSTEKIINNLSASMLYVSVLQQQNVRDIQRIADFGSGGGFPGIPLAVFFPDIEITLIDSSRKKTLFLKKCVNVLGIKADIINSRIEDIYSDEKDKYNCIVAHAFAPLGKLYEYSKPLIRKDGVVFTLKGKNYLDELVSGHTENIKLFQEEFKEKFYDFAPFLKEKTMLRLEF
jgi:16S rRNA (guanine527-N7)-methyltransferase